MKIKTATLALIFGLLNIDHSFGDTSTMATLQTAKACGGLAQAAFTLKVNGKHRQHSI